MIEGHTPELVEVRGGVRLLRYAKVVGQRRYLHDDRFRERAWADARRALIDALAEKTGLPFHLAICAIERWREEELDFLPDQHYGLPRDLRPVLFQVTAWVREVRRYEGQEPKA